MNPTKKKNTSNSSAEIVGSIDDLLIEILLRLPVEALFHFKIVSKHWRSVIGDPEFRRRYKVKPAVPAVGMFLPTTLTNSKFIEYVPFFPKDSRKRFQLPSDITRIVHACNGLLLCEKETNNYYVYNPTTSQCSITLPKLDRSRIEGMHLAFDPANSLYPYKVVCVHSCLVKRESITPSNICNQRLFQIEIYSPGEGEWRSSGLKPFPAVVDFSHGVYWNNAIHWITSGDGDAALYFDVRHHTISKMPNPPRPHLDTIGTRKYYFANSCGHLHIVQNRGSELDFSVYEMKRDYSHWFIKYHIDLSPLVFTNPPIISQCSTLFSYPYRLLSIVLGKGEEEDDALFMVLQLQGKEVIRYDIAARTYEKLREFEDVEPVDPFFKFRRINGFEYIESFCPI